MEITIVSSPIANYADLYTSPENEVLHHLSLETQALVPGAHMLSGHLQGQLLRQISMMLQPNCIVEVGTYTGYSAICLAAGLQPNGLLHTIDVDTRWQALRERFWGSSGLTNQIKMYQEDGLVQLEQLATQGIQPQLAFIDADKRNYIAYYEKLKSMMLSGSYILADNVLFRGEVIIPVTEQGKTATYMHQFNQHVAADSMVEQVLLTIRDGLLLVRIK